MDLHKLSARLGPISGVEYLRRREHRKRLEALKAIDPVTLRELFAGTSEADQPPVFAVAAEGQPQHQALQSYYLGVDPWSYVNE